MEPKMESYTEYAGLYIRDRKEPGGGYVVCDTSQGGCNVMPGATWFDTVEEAMRGIDVHKVVDGNGAKFWHLWWAIKGHV